jgi:hypothetical protein
MRLVVDIRQSGGDEDVAFSIFREAVPSEQVSIHS